MDAERQWFKSKVGVEQAESSLDVSFCAHAVLENDLFVVPDATLDDRFASNPLVVSDPGIRFYAARQLVTDDGHALGTLCVLDRIPRDLTDDQRTALDALARQTVGLLEQRRGQGLLRREMGFAKLLQETANAANEAASARHAVATCLEFVCGHTGWPAGHAVRLDGHEGAPGPRSAGLWHFADRETFDELRQTTEAGQSLSGRDLIARVLETGKPSWADDLAADENLARRQAAGATGLRTVVVVPVFIRREAVAVLEFFATESLDPADRVLEVLRNVGAQLGRALERDRAERALAHRFAELTAVLDATAEGICLSDHDGKVRYVNTAMEALWNELGLTGRGSVWSRFLELAEHTTEASSFLEGVQSLAGNPSESARGEFVLDSGRAFLGYSVPVVADEDSPTGRLFVFREITSDREVERLKDEFLAC